MASSQCYRPGQEITCETKCHDNTYGHKVSQMAGMGFKENHHGHEHNGNNNQGHFYGHGVSQLLGIGCKENYHGHEHNGYNNQGHFYGQSNGYHNSHPDHAINKTQTTVVKTQCTECVKNQSHGQHSTNHSHGHNNIEYHSSSSHGNGIGHCNGKTEKKVENKCEYKKKKSYSKKSCSGSDSD